MFAEGSVRVIGPVVNHRPDRSFNIIGIGFVVEIRIAWSSFDTTDDYGKPDENYTRDWASFEAAVMTVRQEAIDKLLKGSL